MGEGNTPLVCSLRIGPSLGLPRLFFKLESCNPSGSFKDRFIAGEMTRILRSGKRPCLATSSGNTGSSLAAYCARYSVTCVIVVNDSVPAGKLIQMEAHGAHVLRVKDFANQVSVSTMVISLLTQIADSGAASLVISAYRYCPEGMANIESIAHELLHQTGSAIHHVFVPVGGGGLFSAVCRGFAGKAPSGPRVHAVQPQGCSTVVAAFQRGDSNIEPVQSTTRISGLAVPFDIDASLALGHLRQCAGSGFAVEDEEVFQAQAMILRQEGIYTEPAGATALAGLIQARKTGIVQDGETVVCLITGHGFKDPEAIERVIGHHESAATPVGQLGNRVLGILGAG